MPTELAHTWFVYGWAKRAATLLLLVGACEADGDRDRICTDIGCASGASFDLGLFAEADFARLTGARIQVCLGTACADRVIDVLPAAPNEVSYLTLNTSADPRIAVSLVRTDPGTIGIQVEVESGQPDLFHDGDVYTVSLVASDGGPLLNRSWSVSYETSQPNGPDCEPTCRSATTLTSL